MSAQPVTMRARLFGPEEVRGDRPAQLRALLVATFLGEPAEVTQSPQDEGPAPYCESPQHSDPEEVQMDASRSVGRRVDLGSDKMTREPAEGLQGNYATRRHNSGLVPARHSALPDPKRTRNTALAPSAVYRLLNNISAHDWPIITEIDKAINTESDIERWQATDMIRARPQSTFWDRLQEALRANDLDTSQVAIGKMFKVRQSAVSKWKAGGHPQMKRVQEIAARLKYNVNWLLTEEGPARPSGVGEPDDTAELLRIWKSLPLAARRSILSQVRVMRDMQESSRKTESI